LSRSAQIDGCPDGCWLVLGEGLNDAWSATADGVDLGPPQLVDGGFNGWRIPPTDDPVDVVMQWTAQGPQTIAMLISALGILGCFAIAALDRRSSATAAVPVARFATGEGQLPDRTRWIAAGVWVVAAALLVGVGWALLAAVAGAVLIVHLGRPRLAGFVTVGLLVVIGLVVARVVQRERPFPNAGWPARFEWLHGLGLFAAVTLIVSAFGGDRPGAVAASGADGSPAYPFNAGGQRAPGEDGEQRGERQVEPGAAPEQERHGDE
jgi:arabinofuranan 3-O-arabinosyltransferase